MLACDDIDQRRKLGAIRISYIYDVHDVTTVLSNI